MSNVCGCCGLVVRKLSATVKNEKGEKVQVGPYCELKISQLGFRAARVEVAA